MDCSPPGSSVDGVSQARILESVAFSFSRGYSWARDQTLISCIGRQILYHWATREAGSSMCSVVSDSATLWTVAWQAPLSMGFSRQEYWSGFPCPPPGDLPNPGIKPRSPTLQVDSLPSKPPKKPPIRLHLNQFHLQRPCFHLGSHSKVSGEPVFGGTLFNPL